MSIPLDPGAGETLRNVHVFYCIWDDLPGRTRQYLSQILNFRSSGQWTRRTVKTKPPGRTTFESDESEFSSSNSMQALQGN